MAHSQNPPNSSFRQSQFRWKTDPTFYPTARLAMESPAERYAYVAALAPDGRSRSDALLVVDVDASSGSYGRIVGQLDLPNIGDELHHFGWNACSTALCPYAPHPHRLLAGAHRTLRSGGNLRQCPGRPGRRRPRRDFPFGSL